MNKMTPLCEIAYRYGTDKCPQIGHGYTPVYYEMFKDRREEVKKVLELGIGRQTEKEYYEKRKIWRYPGASLKMWKDFFPNAQIYGADILPSVMLEEDRIKTFICDERKEKDLKALIEKTGSDIDIFIDDASHRYPDQIFTAKTLMPLLDKDITYIIEDISNGGSVKKHLAQYEQHHPYVLRGRHIRKLLVLRNRKKNFNFFYPEKHKMWLSSAIRGRQLAPFLNAEINPKEFSEDDVNIYIKPSVIDGYVPDGAWVDIADGGKFIKKLIKRPKVNVIVNSIASYNYLKDRLENKILYVPHHHLNWERAKRKRSEITTCGYTGSGTPEVREVYERIEKAIKAEGMDFITCYKFHSRQQAIEFYEKIDILVIGGWELGDHNVHKAPTKIINAASFGIPTVAYPLRGYEEIEGYYLPARKMKQLVRQVRKLRNKRYYKKWVKKIVPMTEKHHIDNTLEFYEKLAHLPSS